MNDITTLVLALLYCQALGAFVGALTAVWGEISFISAVRNGKTEVAERLHLHVISNGLKFGLSLSLLSSFALVIASYSLHGYPQPALTLSYWIFMTLSILIIIISWALARKYITLALGSASAITAWWLLAYLTLGRLPVNSFISAIALYVVLTAIIYALLRYVRFLAFAEKKEKP